MIPGRSRTTRIVKEIGKTIRVRILGIEDEEEASKVSRGIYDGYDYMMPYFNDWVTDPFRFVFGLEVNEEAHSHNENDSTVNDCWRLVGMDTLSLLDHHRQSGLEQALRISESHRGKGLSFILTSTIVEFVKQHLPDVRCIRAANSITNISMTSKVNKGFKLLTNNMDGGSQRSFNSEKLHLLHQRHCVQQKTVSTTIIKQVTGRELINYLNKNEKIKQSLAPNEHNLMCTYWMYIDYSDENILLWENYPFYSNHIYFVELRGETNSGDSTSCQELVSFSFCSDIKVENGFGLSFSILCNNNFDSYMNHWRFFLDRIFKHNCDNQSGPKYSFMTYFWQMPLYEQVAKIVTCCGDSDDFDQISAVVLTE